MSANIKYFHSAMTGAPVLSGTTGALIAVLDACLVDGFGLKSVDSIVVAGGIATATIASGHIFEKGTCVTIAGATPSGLTGEKKVLSATTTAFTFDAGGIADGAATGTITAKLTPAGFTKLYAGTNLAAYKSANVAATGGVLRVDDTAAQQARVRGYETMSDVNTGTGPTPTDTQVSGGLFWPKSTTANTTAREWVLVADDRTFYILLMPNSFAPVKGLLAGFGDMIPNNSADSAYSWFVSGQTATDTGLTSSASYPGCLGYSNYNQTTSGRFAPRSYTGLGSSVRLGNANLYLRNGVAWSGGGASGPFVAFPNGPDGGLYYERVRMLEDQVSGSALRGELPGIMHMPQALGETFQNKDKMPATAALVGRTLIALRPGNGSATAAIGVVAADLTGPWR